MIKKLIVSALIFINQGLSAQSLNSKFENVDPHNTYQFNRSNHFKQNGKIDQTPWFEWWYYKVVIPEKNKSYYFVYGVVNPWDSTASNKASRSYVGVGDFTQNITLEQQFEISDFRASYDETNISVGDANLATANKFSGSIRDPKGYNSNWNISIENKWTFNALGSITGKNISNIEWYPAQADARCSGEVTVNNVRESFTNAPCYQDRNWGSVFPKWWAWVVSNHFEKSPDTTLAIGGGNPSILNKFKKIEGLVIGLKHQGKEYTWRPHDGDWIKFKINLGKWDIEAINNNYKLKIEASAPREKFMDLQFMTPQGPLFHDYETLQGFLKLQLYQQAKDGLHWELLTELTSSQAGLEYGSYDILGMKNLETQNVCLLGCIE